VPPVNKGEINPSILVIPLNIAKGVLNDEQAVEGC
jgi:hypothetical protein